MRKLCENYVKLCEIISFVFITKFCDFCDNAINYHPWARCALSNNNIFCTNCANLINQIIDERKKVSGVSQ